MFLGAVDGLIEKSLSTHTKPEAISESETEIGASATSLDAIDGLIKRHTEAARTKAKQQEAQQFWEFPRRGALVDSVMEEWPEEYPRGPNDVIPMSKLYVNSTQMA